MKRYGYGFRELFRWMDEPSNVTSYRHRKFRHDPWKTPEEAEKIFWDKVHPNQRQNIKHVVMDHINLDGKLGYIYIEKLKYITLRGWILFIFWVFITFIGFGIFILSLAIPDLGIFSIIGLIILIFSIIIIFKVYSNYLNR
jgi:hypothetical protein